MSIRVSSNQMVYGYQKQLNDANTRQTSLLEQGDGSKLHRPSDNPVDYSKFLRYDTSINENEQYTNNVNTALSWMKTADSAMINITNIQTTFKEKSILAANSTNNGTDMQAIGKEMMAEIQEIVSLGNTMQGDRYVFGGQKDLVRPFELSTEEVDRGLAKILDETQAAYFKTADSSGTMTQMLVLEDEADPNNLYYLDTTTGRLYTKDFVENGYKNEKIAGKTAATDDDIADLYENEEYSHGKMEAGYNGTGTLPSGALNALGAGLNPPVTLGEPVYLVQDTSGTFYYGDSTTGKVYDATLKEVGTFPSKDYKYAPERGNGSVYNPVGPLVIYNDDGDQFFADDSQGSNGPIFKNFADVKSDFTKDDMDAGKIVDDLYGVNQKYTWSSNYFDFENGEPIYVGVKDANGNQYYYDQKTKDIYTEKYLQDCKDSGKAVDYGKSIGNMKSMYIAANFDNRGKILDQDTVGDDIVNAGADYETNIIDEYGRTVTLKLSTVKQQLVTYTGDEKQISMVKKNGTTEPTADTVNATGSDIFGMDLFDDPNSGNAPSGTAMLNEMLTVHAKVVSDDQLWMDTDGVTVADSAHAQTVKTETKMGARTQLYNSVSTMLTNQNELITSDITNVSSTDVARLAVQLMQEQTIYNMSLSLGGRILPQSLADYL
jgi:flagellin-like hook-associated protein FlgL